MKIALLTLLRLLCTTSATTRETSTSAIEADEIEPTLQFLKKNSRTSTRPRFRGGPRTVRGPEQRGMHHKNYDRQPTYVNQIADVFNIYCVV